MNVKAPDCNWQIKKTVSFLQTDDVGPVQIFTGILMESTVI